MSEYVINANSKPDFDEWGYDDYWSIDDWINWHDAMKKSFGKKTANTKFIDAWNKNSFGNAITSARTFNTKFRNYAKLNGFYDDLFTGDITDPLFKVTGSATDVVDSGTKAVSNVAKGAENTSKAFKIILPIGLGIITITGAAIAYNKYQESK